MGLHVDGCLGGFILPWGQVLGYDIPTFDFRLPGVTAQSYRSMPPSISADLLDAGRMLGCPRCCHFS